MNYEAARRNMVESQLRANRVTDDGLLAAVSSLPRERFLPVARVALAYVDEDIEVAPGRYLLEPMVLARLIQALDVQPGDMVLDVACATGYSTAVLARLAGTVVAAEEVPELTRTANDTLNALGVDNAVVVEAPHRQGYVKQAPYDAILINGAVAEVPPALVEQLNEGGRLGVVVKDGPGLGRATLFTKLGGSLSRRILFDAGTPLLPGFAKETGFVF